MTGAVPLEAAISLENLRAGREEWFNVQDPVRNALELIFAHLQDNGQSLRRLDASTMALEKTSLTVESLKQEVCGLMESSESHDSRLKRVEGRLEELGDGLAQSEEEKRAKAAERRLEGVCAELQAAVAEAKAEAAAAGNAREADRKEAERRVADLRGRVDELERGKVDRAAMKKFTGDVLDAFDSATTETERKLENMLGAELQGLRSETEARLQGLASAQELQRVASELEGLMEAMGQIRAGVEQMQRDAESQAPPCTREEAHLIASELLRQRDANGDREELRAAVQRAHEAANAAMAAVEGEANALKALKERVNAMQPKVNSAHEALYGSSPNTAMSPPSSPLRHLLGGSGAHSRSSAPPALTPRQKTAVGALKRLEAAEEQLQNLLTSELPSVTSELATKADKAALEAVARKADANAAGIEELSNETVARAEDVAKSISALSRGLNAHLQDRLTHSTVQAMIDEAAAAIDEETVRKIRAMMDHTHVVEHSERVLVQEDGTPVVIDSGPLRGVKLSEGGAGAQRASAELWERVSRLDAVLEAVQMRLEEQEGRSRRQPPSPSPNMSPEVQAAAAFAGSIKRRVDLLEAAREATEHKLQSVSQSVQVVAKKAEDAAAVGAAHGASGKEQEEMRWEVLMDRLSTILDEKASHEEVRRALIELEERLEPRSAGGRQVGGGGTKAPLGSFGMTDELEARLRSLISSKADKEAVEEMFSSCRKAIDARPSRAEVQAALKEKLDTRAFIAGSRQTGGVGGAGGGGAGGAGAGAGAGGATSSFTPRTQFVTPGAPASASASGGPHQAPRSGYSEAAVVQSQYVYSSSRSARAALEEQARTLF